MLVCFLFPFGIKNGYTCVSSHCGEVHTTASPPPFYVKLGGEGREGGREEGKEFLLAPETLSCVFILLYCVVLGTDVML